MTLPTRDNTPNPRGRGFGAALDGLLLRLAVGPGRRLTIEDAPLQAPRVDTSENPHEHVRDFGDVFARDDFSGGEGLRHAHRRDRPEGATSRYWDSRNVDVSDSPDRRRTGIRLLPTTEQIDQSSNANLHLAVAADALWMASGTGLRRTTTPSAATPTFTTVDPHNSETATPVEAVTVLGTGEVYAALGTNGIHRDTGSGWAHWSDLEATGVWAAAERIMAVKDESIYEVVTGGAAPSPIHTLADGDRWTDVAHVGDAILACATNGHIYAFRPNEDGELVLAAQSLIPGEQPTAVTAAQGLVVFTTAQPVAGGVVGRLWRAVLNSDLVLSDRQLLRQWGDSSTLVDQAPRRLLASREEVYTAVPDGDGEVHLWRYDLAGGGMTRSLVIPVDGVSPALAMFDGRLFVSVAEDGLWRESELLADEGWLIGPLGDFFTAENKSWVSARIDTDIVQSGQRVELYFTTDELALSDPESPSWRRVKRLSAGVDTAETALGDVTARAIAGMVRLRPSTDRKTSPTVYAFGFRAYPSEADTIVQLPVNVSDHIVAPNRRPVRVAGRGQEVLTELLSRKGRHAVLEVFRPPLLLRGLVEAVGTPVEAVGPRGSVTAYSMVRFRGRATSLSTTVDPSALGVEQLGTTVMGGLT